MKQLLRNIFTKVGGGNFTFPTNSNVILKTPARVILKGVKNLETSTKTFLSLLLISTAFASCTHETESFVPKGTPLQLSVKTVSIETRGLIESATLPDGEAHSIGLTLVDAGEATYDGRTYNNIKATPSTAGGKQSWAMASDIYLSSTTGTLYGYYPYSSSVTNIEQIPVTAGETDYMYATPVNNLDDGKYTASVTMNHALAAIRLKVVRGTYTGTGAVTAVSVKGDNIATSGKLNAKIGVLSGQSGAGTAITYSTAFTLSTTAKQIDHIIVPITSSSAAPSFTVTIDDKDYTATPAAVTLAQGTIYEYTLTVNAKEISLSDVKVGDWGYNNSGNPVINAGYDITLAGDLTGIAIHSMTDGTVTRGAADTGGTGDTYLIINAVPVEENQAVKKATAVDVGSANVIQNINERGVLTITIPLSTMTKDLTISFNGTELLGTIDFTTADNGVYAVAGNGKGVSVEDADESCIAVALIVTGASTYNNSRVAADDAGHGGFTPQRIMIEKTQSYDATNTYFYWSNRLYGKNVAGITEISTADGTNHYGSLGYDLSTDYTTWTSGALSDFNGKDNTNAIITAYTEHSVDMDTQDMCKVLQIFNAGTYGSNQGFTDWYIPACGQLALIYLNKTAINEALTAIGGTTFSEFYWSSSEYSGSKGWGVDTNTGGVDGDGKNNSDIYWVRFVRDIQ